MEQQPTPRYILLLGDNKITDCEAALVIDGEEVFRLRNQDRDGQLIVDFDLRAADDSRIAKFAKNHAPYVHQDYEYRHLPRVSEVVEKSTGRVVGRVEQVWLRCLKLTGVFHVNGAKYEINENGILDASDNLISGCTIEGSGKAVALSRDSMSIGLR